MTSAPGLALFDLDGTLVDSAPDIAAAVDDALTANGRQAIGETQVREYIGNGARRLIHRAITAQLEKDAADEIFEPVYQSFVVAYDARVYELSRLYPDARQTLQDLQQNGWRLALVTNKPMQFTSAVIKAAGLGAYFNVIVGGDSLAQQKPQPQPLLFAAEHCAVALNRCVMIGDSSIDMNAAHNAGMAAIAVDYGYHRGANLAEYGPLAVISALAEVPHVLAQMNG